MRWGEGGFRHLTTRFLRIIGGGGGRCSFSITYHACWKKPRGGEEGWGVVGGVYGVTVAVAVFLFYLLHAFFFSAVASII